MTFLILLKLKQWGADLCRIAMEHKLTVLAILLLIAVLLAGWCNKRPDPKPSLDLEAIEKQAERIEDRERGRLANTVNAIDNRIKEADNRVRQTGNRRNINAGDLENKLK